MRFRNSAVKVVVPKGPLVEKAEFPNPFPPIDDPVRVIRAAALTEAMEAVSHIDEARRLVKKLLRKETEG